MNEAHVDIADLQKKVSDFRALLSADKARKNLMPFIEETFPNYKPAAHHRLIADKLEAVERGEIKRLMIFCPPQHGKSQILVVRQETWCKMKNIATYFLTSLSRLTRKQRIVGTLTTTVAITCLLAFKGLQLVAVLTFFLLTILFVMLQKLILCTGRQQILAGNVSAVSHT